MYLDSEGIETVGAGFNLRRPDARERLAEVGADFDAVFSGAQQISQTQSEKLFLHTWI
jgi:hypothetical protein